MRSRALTVIGTVMYVVAWFVPTLFVPAFKIDLPFQGTDLGPLTIPGWEAFRFALGAFDPPWYYAVLRVASALSNLAVVAALALVFIARRSPPRFLRVMLVASAVLNAHWFVLGFRSGLRIGYYLWASSFFVVAAGLILEGRRSGLRRTPAG